MLYALILKTSTETGWKYQVLFTSENEYDTLRAADTVIPKYQELRYADKTENRGIKSQQLHTWSNAHLHDRNQLSVVAIISFEDEEALNHWKSQRLTTA